MHQTPKLSTKFKNQTLGFTPIVPAIVFSFFDQIWQLKLKKLTSQEAVITIHLLKMGYCKAK